MIVRIALLLVSIPLLAHGADGLSHAFRSRTQAAVTCEEFLRSPPSSGWVRITGCEIDYMRAGYRASAGRVAELYFPAGPANAVSTQPAPIVIATADPAVIALAEHVVSGPARTDQESFLVLMLRIVTATRASSEIEGATRSPLERRRTRNALSAVNAPLSSDVAVIDLHERPRALLPALETAVGGLALLAVVVLSVRLRRRVDAEPATPAERDEDVPGSAPPAGRPAYQGPSLRRLMLVNLPAHAAPVALEEAPPLGAQTFVRSALAQVLPGITFTDDGVGRFEGPDHVIRLELGQAPETWTATLDVTGDGAAPALRRLITQTGWRAYAPQLGRFITAEDLRA